MSRATAVGLVALLVSSAALEAQMSPGARSVAMGGGGMVFATGVDAVEWNPANLGWAGGWNLSLGGIGMAGLSEGATLDEIFTIFGAEVAALGLGDLDVATVVNGLPAEGIRISGVTEGFSTARAAGAANVPQPGSPLPSIGVAVGPIAIRARSRVFSSGRLSKELADLIGNGYDDSRVQEYAVGNTGWSSTSVSEVTVSYGTTLGGLLSVGVGGRYVLGHGMVQGRFFEPQIDLNCIGVTTGTCDALTVQSVAVEASEGTGYGLDVGLSLELPLGFRAAASGTNVVQRMTWDTTALVAHTATYTDTDFDDQSLEFIDMLDRFTAQPITSGGGVSLAVYEAASGLLEESYYPQVFRGGVGWQSGGTSLEAVGIKVAPRGRYTTSWDERVSLGIEQKIPLLTLRAGYALAQDGLTALTGGVALRFGPVHLESSGGRFSGDGVGTTFEGYFATIALQVKGGGL